MKFVMYLPNLNGFIIIHYHVIGTAKKLRISFNRNKINLIVPRHVVPLVGKVALHFIPEITYFKVKATSYNH